MSLIWEPTNHIAYTHPGDGTPVVIQRWQEVKIDVSSMYGRRKTPTGEHMWRRLETVPWEDVVQHPPTDAP